MTENEEIEDTPYLANKRLIIKFSIRLDDIEKKLNEVTALIDLNSQSISAGLNNVYREFQSLVSGTLLADTENKMQKMKNDVYDLKKELLRDMNFVKKCYKIMPALSKIKELDEESFERLHKVVELLS